MPDVSHNFAQALIDMQRGISAASEAACNGYFNIALMEIEMLRDIWADKAIDAIRAEKVRREALEQGK